jgi:biotin carboxyl carrier protein
MEENLTHKGKSLTIRVEQSGDSCAVAVGDVEFAFQKELELANEFKALVNGERKTFFIARNRNDVAYVFYEGRQFVFESKADAQYGSGGVLTEGGDFVSSPMPGTIIKITCTEGDVVAENDTLVIVEAMKMENVLRSPVAGTVAKVNYKEGDLVNAGSPIVELETAGKF